MRACVRACVCACVRACVCVLFDFRQFFFTLGTRLRISKFCVDRCKKSDCTRCLAVSILELVQYKLEFEVGRASESVLVF